MSTASQFGGGAMPVGALVQAAYTLTDPAYLLANGAKVLRATYPLFAATQPGVNTFTYTARTKGAAGGSSAIASHAGLWVMSAVAGANNIQTTPDGITFTQRVTPAAMTSCDVRSLISDGTNVVGVATSSTGADGFYSADGITFTQATGAPGCNASSQQCVMAFAATLGTVGRFIVAVNLNFYTSDNRGVTWTAQAHGLGPQAFSVAWTGAKFIATTGAANTIFTSPTGLAGSWVSQALTVTLDLSSASVNSIASDGAGRVCIVNNNQQQTAQSLLVSQDHGVTWIERIFITPQLTPPTQRMVFREISFTNGLFFLPATGICVLVSKDAIGWVVLTDLPNALVQGVFSYKAGVYFVSSNLPLTVVEDTTKVYLPLISQVLPSSTSVGGGNSLTYVKVA